MVTHESVQSSTIEGRNRRKIFPLNEIPALCSECIFTKGVFDILHSGHLSLFSYLESIKHRRSLVVGVTSDSATQRKKGPLRPINHQTLRLQQICNLSVVDFVFLHEEDNYVSAIEILSPSVYVKGMDTTTDFRGELNFAQDAEFVVLPTKSHFVRFCDDGLVSSTQIIARIVELHRGS